MAELSKEKVSNILKLKESDITLEFLKKTFADTDSSKREMNFQDSFTLPKNTFGNKSIIRTTVGRYIVNIYLFSKFIDRFHYVNEPMNKKKINSIIGEITEKMLEDKISEEETIDFMNRLSWMGFSTSSFTSPPFDLNGLVCPPKTAKLRKELFKKYDQEIKDGDPKTVALIEKELITSARDELKGEPILDYYDSGARGSFDNNYKNTVLMRGLVPDPARPGKFKVSLGNLVDGSPLEDQYIGANILLAGAGGRALETRRSGLASLTAIVDAKI